MSKATSQITDGDSLKNQEQTDKENYATQNYPQEGVGASEVRAAEKKVREDDQKEVEVKEPTFNVNFVSDEEYEKELQALIYSPQGESIIVLGPRVQQSKSVSSGVLKLDEATKKRLLDEQLQHHEPGYRVLAISPQVISQILDMAKKTMPMMEDEDEYNSNLMAFVSAVFYKTGDYVFSPRSQVIRQMEFIYPNNPNLGYYEIFHREVAGFIRHEDILTLKAQYKAMKDLVKLEDMQEEDQPTED